uniref:Putative ATPase domain containing protein n=1 Tax=viral metagenome TaxID=1070528 RepID=A0A6M3IU64_9ZZZZ
MKSTNIWTFKYEPQEFGDIILNDTIKPQLKKAIIEVPNLLLCGPPGVGKGTYTNIFLKETKLDYIKINCSDETGIDNLRTKVKSFAQSLGISDLKIVVMNEVDFLSLYAQAMLRDFMEQVQKITRFIFQCNYGHKIIKEIYSRCQVVEINSPPAKDIFTHCIDILTKEKIQINNKKAIIDLIKSLYPDIRGIINTLQLNTVNGVLDGINYNSVNEVYDKILNDIKRGDLDLIRKTLRSNSIDYTELYSYLFDNIDKFKSPGDAILLIGEYLYRNSIIAIKEINFMTMVVSMMKNGVI